MKLTDLEKKVLTNIALNQYTALNGAEPEEAEDACCWVNTIADCGPCDIEPTSLPGVMGSLAKKNLVWTDGETCWFTEAGFDAYKAIKK